MALVNRAYNDVDYNIIARLSRELRPGMIWVTSGATEIGRLDYIKRNGRELTGSDEEIKTDYAAQGQSILMQSYRQFVDSRFSLRQILVEHQHFNDKLKREHLKKLLMRCPVQNAIPVVNYNDPLSYEENVKNEIAALSKNADGPLVYLLDNDETAAQIACLVKSEYLMILTGVDGIYVDKDDPNSLVKEISGKDVYELVQNIERCQEFCVGTSRKGANGARAKLEYMKQPAANGTTVIIANSKYRISEILTGGVPRTVIAVR